MRRCALAAAGIVAVLGTTFGQNTPPQPTTNHFKFPGSVTTAKMMHDQATGLTPAEIKQIGDTALAMVNDLQRYMWYTTTSLQTRTMYYYEDPIPPGLPKDAKPRTRRPEPVTSTFRVTRTQDALDHWVIKTEPLTIGKTDERKGYAQKKEWNFKRQDGMWDTFDFVEAVGEFTLLGYPRHQLDDIAGDIGRQLKYAHDMQVYKGLAEEGLTNNKPQPPMRYPVSPAFWSFEREKVATEADDRLPAEAIHDLTVRERLHMVEKDDAGRYIDTADHEGLRVIQYDVAAGMRPRKVTAFNGNGMLNYVIRIQWANIGTPQKPEWFPQTVDRDVYIAYLNQPQKVDDLKEHFRAEVDVGSIVRHESLYKPSPLFQGKFPGKLQGS
jgi:hypothetical protein